KPLPVKNPEELVSFSWLFSRTSMIAGYSGTGGVRDKATGLDVRTSFSFLTFERFRSSNRTLTDVFAFSAIGVGQVNVTVSVQSGIASGLVVTGGYFSGLGVPAVLGRTIASSDDSPIASSVAVISYGYGQDRFGGASDIIGKTIAVISVSVVVVGVAPAELYG